MRETLVAWYDRLVGENAWWLADVRPRLVEADAEFAKMEQHAHEAHALLRDMNEAQATLRVERDRLRKDVEYFSQQAGARGAACEREKLRSLRECRMLRKEMEELRRRLAAEKEVARSLHLRMVDAPRPPSRTEPSRLEIAMHALIAVGATDVRREEPFDAAVWAANAAKLADALIAKVRGEDAPGAWKDGG